MSKVQSCYKKKESCQWKISVENISQQNSKIFEDSECQKCDELNNFVSEVGKSLSAIIMPHPVTYRHFLKNVNSKNSLFLAPTDAYEIQPLIKNLKAKSNSSPNDISSKFVKMASCIVSEWLCNFFSKCMTIGEFPYLH